MCNDLNLVPSFNDDNQVRDPILYINWGTCNYIIDSRSSETSVRYSWSSKSYYNCVSTTCLKTWSDTLFKTTWHAKLLATQWDISENKVDKWWESRSVPFTIKSDVNRSSKPSFPTPFNLCLYRMTNRCMINNAVTMIGRGTTGHPLTNSIYI